MAGAAARNAHRIEQVAIFLQNARADAAATAREPEARMRQTEIMAEFVARHARAEVPVGQPQAGTADKSKSAKDGGRPGASANDVEIEISRRVASLDGDLASDRDEVREVVIVNGGSVGQA